MIHLYRHRFCLPKSHLCEFSVLQLYFCKLFPLSLLEWILFGVVLRIILEKFDDYDTDTANYFFPLTLTFLKFLIRGTFGALYATDVENLGVEN